MKLNLGAGRQPLDGYINLDGANGDSIYPLNYSEVDEIRASHVLEHFGIEESVDVVANWIGCLKTGGVLKIAVPDIDEILRRRDEIDIESYIMGGQTDERDYHKSLWANGKLRKIMEHLGLSNIRTWQSEIADCASLSISLNLMGEKL